VIVRVILQNAAPFGVVAWPDALIKMRYAANASEIILTGPGFGLFFLPGDGGVWCAAAAS
jgi:hypothetical protein